VKQMPYEDAAALVAAFTAGIVNEDDDWQPAPEDVLDALATRNRLEAIEPALAFATIWRHDVDEPGFVMPPLRLVAMVEYLIGEPVLDEAVLQRRRLADRPLTELSGPRGSAGRAPG
jgi:hypothetical protein